MNRGRHKNIKIPYGAYIILRCYFAYKGLPYCEYIRVFKSMEQLNCDISYYLYADQNIKKIEILYKGKLIKTY